MKTKKFTRRNSKDYSKLGKKRKKLQRWRKPKGRDNKMRLQVKGRPGIVKVGYKKPENERGKLNGKVIFKVSNISDMKKIPKNAVLLIGKMGAKKRIEIEKIAEEQKIKPINLSKKKINKETTKK